MVSISIISGFSWFTASVVLSLYCPFFRKITLSDINCYSEIRQVDKTKVTNESKDIFFIVQGNKETSDKYVKDIAKELITVVTYYLGGTDEIL